jgi:hypothetical protein
MAVQRPTSQAFSRVNWLFTGAPRQVPVTSAFCGPPYCSAHVVDVEAFSAFVPFAPRTPHATAGDGCEPPTGSHVSVHVARMPKPSSSRIFRAADPAAADGVRPLPVTFAVGSSQGTSVLVRSGPA